MAEQPGHEQVPTRVVERPAGTLDEEQLRLIDAYWRAANYLSVGQIYLLDNPLLREPLRIEQVKPRLLGHWGTTPGLNFVYVHMNRVIKARDMDAMYVILPRGHLHRRVSPHHPRRGRAPEAFPPVLLPGRHPEPRRARNAGIDP
jgi:xylulose-5-phosphate/fructose-6-phosphate phosphoketolase